MSQIITSAKARLAERASHEDLRDQLAEEPLSKVLRRGTWGAHEAAEYSDFEQALVKGVLKVEAYRDLLAQTYPVYVALEEGDRVLADHPVVSQIISPELDRSANVDRDLQHFYGADWRDEYDELPVTAEYVARIRAVVADEPVRYVAHHYTRYLADLSGGIHIDRAITRAYSLDVAGHEVYDFRELGDVDEFKQAYRRALDGLDVSVDDKIALVEEAMIAYEFNIGTIKALSGRYAPFASAGAVPAAAHPHAHAATT